jgi:hypothetical protein
MIEATRTRSSLFIIQCIKSEYGIDQLDIWPYNASLTSSFTESSKHVSMTDFAAALEFKAYIFTQIYFWSPESQYA